MNIVVIGLGSMGKRRIRLIKELFPLYNIYGVDEREDRRLEVTELFGIKCYDKTNSIYNDYYIDVAFVCTSPISHNEIINECLRYKWNVFTEINLVEDGYDENIKLAQDNNCVLFLSSTFFYREEIKYIRNSVKKKNKWNYVYHIGQYLPNWHPWEKYNNFFIGNKKTNGCREIMAIELPWLIDTFGKINNMNVIKDKITQLNIDFNDNYMIQIKHENGNKGTLIVDVVSPVAVRNLEIYSEKQYIRWHGTPDSLFEYNENNNELNLVRLSEKEEHKEGYSNFIVENAYKNEIKEFFDVLQNNKKIIYGFKEDKEILKLINKVEE